MKYNHGSDISSSLPYAVGQKQATSPAHTHGRGLNKDMNSNRQRSLGVTLGFVCPTYNMELYGKYRDDTIGEYSLKNLKQSRKNKNNFKA